MSITFVSVSRASMSLSMCVPVCVSVHVCVHTCLSVCVPTCMCVSACMYVAVCVHARACVAHPCAPGVAIEAARGAVSIGLACCEHSARSTRASRGGSEARGEAGAGTVGEGGLLGGGSTAMAPAGRALLTHKIGRAHV